MIQITKVEPSTRKDKKYQATLSTGKIIHFGLYGSNTNSSTPSEFVFTRISLLLSYTSMFSMLVCLQSIRQYFFIHFFTLIK